MLPSTFLEPKRDKNVGRLTFQTNKQKHITNKIFIFPFSHCFFVWVWARLFPHCLCIYVMLLSEKFDFYKIRSFQTLALRKALFILNLLVFFFVRSRSIRMLQSGVSLISSWKCKTATSVDGCKKTKVKEKHTDTVFQCNFSFKLKVSLIVEMEMCCYFCSSTFLTVWNIHLNVTNL